MTVKDLRNATAPYIDIDIVYGNPSNTINIAAEDYVTLEAFGSFVIDVLSIKDEETIAATIKMQPVKE